LIVTHNNLADGQVFAGNFHEYAKYRKLKDNLLKIMVDASLACQYKAQQAFDFRFSAGITDGFLNTKLSGCLPIFSKEVTWQQVA
jgi:hypothetical protein